MRKSFRSMVLIVLAVFTISYLFSLLSVLLSGNLNGKVAFYLFFGTLISIIIIVTILGEAFTSLISYFLHLRRLLKLNNLTSPLLIRLSKEAPGTYHHSILVADLASKAAADIGTDSLLCRIGGYFHDVGKLKNPHLFIENQNNHLLKNEEKKDYQTHAQEIISHVKEGVFLSKEAHLPPEAINLIAQHHGTTISKYYFEKAKEKNPTKINRRLFRYSGPKPQTKDAAILMLADDIEARSRIAKDKLEKPTDFDLFVDHVIKEKIHELQFSDVKFSTVDFLRLRKSFSQTLQSMYHARIKYPGES